MIQIFQVGSNVHFKCSRRSDSANATQSFQLHFLILLHYLCCSHVSNQTQRKIEGEPKPHRLVFGACDLSNLHFPLFAAVRLIEAEAKRRHEEEGEPLIARTCFWCLRLC